MSLPIVYVLTENTRKMAAWRTDLRRYRLDLRFASPATEPVTLLADGNVLAVCRETSDLYEPHSNDLSKREDLALVDNVCQITVHTREETFEYRETRHGYIDRADGATEDAKGWWDGIFRALSTHQTYDQMREAGMLRSARDMAVSRFILDKVHFPAPTAHAHMPSTGAKDTIDFSVDPAEVFAANPLLSGPYVEQFGIADILRKALNEGIFFRAAQSQRDRNYWCPPFSGIPLVPKKDVVHETTYLVHDIGHQILPDFVPPFLKSLYGNDIDRRLYIAQRMMSEAMTMVLADMVYVDALYRQGVTYDFGRRRIYPLFRETGIDLTDEASFFANVKKLLWTNVRHCVLGDSTAWGKLLGRQVTPTLDAFEAKYNPFFVEDFRWTVQNWKTMQENAERLHHWWGYLFSLQNMPMTTGQARILVLRDRVNVPTEELVEKLFEWNWLVHVEPALKGLPLLPVEERRRRSFQRWLAGQFGLFGQFDALLEADIFAQTILDFLQRHPDFGLPEIQRVRAFYNTFVDLLRDRGLIDHDDATTFKSVYPLFEPFYVFYDRTSKTQIWDIAKESLRPAPPKLDLV